MRLKGGTLDGNQFPPAPTAGAAGSFSRYANVKIGNVLSDLFGVSGKSMLLALLDGTMSAGQTAQLAAGQAREKIAQLTEA
jgi:hypothetical protein